MTSEKAILWADLMKDLPFEIAIRNLHEHLKSNEFPPKAADIARYDLKTQNHEFLRLETAAQFSNLDQWATDVSEPPEGFWEEIKAKLKGGDGE
nr:hypothetical protein [Paenibacillus harenae]